MPKITKKQRQCIHDDYEFESEYNTHGKSLIYDGANWSMIFQCVACKIKIQAQFTLSNCDYSNDNFKTFETECFDIKPIKTDKPWKPDLF